MKKMSLLALVLIVGLPGCCGKKKESARLVRKTTIERYAEMPDATEVIEVGFEGDQDEEDQDETEDFLDLYDTSEDLDLDDLEEETPEVFSWIDAQTDDEFKKLYFSFNHYGIRADQKESVSYDIDQVKQLIAEAHSAAQPTIVIEGHADQEGTPAYNLALSEKRAKNVADLFVAAGVNRNAIKVVGRGQECPLVINGKVVDGSREDRAPNRRVEVRVIYT